MIFAKPDTYFSIKLIYTAIPYILKFIKFFNNINPSIFLYLSFTFNNKTSLS